MRDCCYERDSGIEERDSGNALRSSHFVNHSYDYRPNWTPLSHITIIYRAT